MRITSLRIENFRAINVAEFASLEEMVVIAGPNGCGKSAVLDALRFLKSAYGGYQQNEFQQFFSEFKVPFKRDDISVEHFMQHQDRNMCIAATLVLSRPEKNYLRSRARDLVRPFVSRQVAPETAHEDSEGRSFARDQRQHLSAIEDRIQHEVAQLREELLEDTFAISLTADVQKQMLFTSSSPVMEIVFSTFEPERLGVFDFHGPDRVYQREQLGSVNLNLQKETKGQHALYNTAGKYHHIKQALASSFFMEKYRSASTKTQPITLTAALQELFQHFFQGKEFLGPRLETDGKLHFDVRLASGAQHDIDDLSAGEKEILYGYLRLWNMKPRHSVLMFDEPELHLNPRLTRGLPRVLPQSVGETLRESDMDCYAFGCFSQTGY